MREKFVRRTFMVTIAAVVVLFAAGRADAQWEAVYGDATSAETGGRGVRALQSCDSSGFVSVGSVSPVGDVRVVRTDASGTPVFERRYDIGNDGSFDRGESIVELRDGSGFVVTGFSESTAPRRNIFLLKIDCNGDFVWASVYATNRDEIGFDIVEATSGDPHAHTSAGDLIVAGVVVRGGDNPDGILMRVQSDGTMIWNRRYDVNDANEMFLSLIEARPNTSVSPTGDIVAVGQLRSGTQSDGFAVRVDGNTGLFGGPDTCAATFGGLDEEVFTGVVELRSTGLTGQLVLVGTTWSASNAQDIYAVRTLPNPCIAGPQRRIGASATAPLGDEFVTDILEQRGNLTLAPLGSLLLTGGVGRPGTQGYDAFLLALEPMSLVPLFGSGRLYGDHGPGYDAGTSLFEVPVPASALGVVIDATSQSDFEGIGDPSDTFLIRTNSNGETICDERWNPPSITENFPVRPVDMNPVAILTRFQVPAGIVREDTAFHVCP